MEVDHIMNTGPSDHRRIDHTSDSDHPMDGIRHPIIPSDLAHPTHPPSDHSPGDANPILEDLFDLDSEDEDEWHDPDVGFVPLKHRKLDKSYDVYRCPVVVIVHTTAVHELRIRPCRCTDTPIREQLLNMALYPASMQHTRTIFTFELLDDYDLENLETKASAAKFYNKVKRLTNNILLDSVPDRYRELLRVAREWRNLKARQRAGLAHSSPDIIEPGGLAIFCPACPQPSINLPENWKEDVNQYVFIFASDIFLTCRLVSKMEIYADTVSGW